MIEKLWNKKYISLIVVNTLSCFSFYMITTILTSYLVDIGSSVSTAGIIVGLFSVTSLVMHPFTGYISDNYNKRYLLLIGMTVIGISVLGYISTDFIPVIILFRIVHGIAFALISTAVVSLASEYIPKQRFNEGIGYLGLGQIISSAVAPGIGVSIMNLLNIRYSFVLSAFFAFLSLAPLILFRYKIVSKTEKTVIKLDNIICIEAIGNAGIGGIYSFANGVISSFIVLFALTKGIKDVSIYFTVCAFFLFIIRPVTGKLANRIDLKYIVYPGLLMSVIAMLVLAGSDSMAMIIISAILRSTAQGAVQPVLQAECIRKAGLDKSGVATSTFYLGADIGQGLGPIIGGFIVGIYGYPAVFYCCSILFALGIIVFFWNERGIRCK